MTGNDGDFAIVLMHDTETVAELPSSLRRLDSKRVCDKSVAPVKSELERYRLFL